MLEKLQTILFILFIADINSYVSDEAELEKYADDILNYTIGRPDNSQLSQNIVDGVQRLCLDNKMRFNTSKCKVLFIPSPTEKTPPSITQNNEALEVVWALFYFILYSLLLKLWLIIDANLRQLASTVLLDF